MDFFREQHARYLDWLDERRNPLSTKIWFGKYKGCEIRRFYMVSRSWNWLLCHCRDWREDWHDDLIDIQRRYVAWKAKQPRNFYKVPARAPREAVGTVLVRSGLRDDGVTYAPQPRREVVVNPAGEELDLQDEVIYARRRGRGPDRAPRVIVNPVGERLDWRDDRVASDADESYDSDDSFVVPDDYVSTEAENSDRDTEDPLESGDKGDGLTLDELLEDLREEKFAADQNYLEIRQDLSLRQSRDNPLAEDIDDPDKGESHSHSEDTDDSLQSLGDIFKTPAKTPVTPKSSPSKRRLVTRSQAKRPSPPSINDGSDTEVEEITEPVSKRNTAPSQSPLKRRRRPIVPIVSSSDSDTPLISPSKKRRAQQRRQQRSSPTSPSVDIDSDSSSDDMPIISPLKNRRGRR